MTKEDRYEVRMLKGIDQSFGPQMVADGILEKLEEKGLKREDFHVDRFETFYSVVNDRPYHMYVVKAENAEIMNMITSIFGLFHMVCKWERMRKRPIIQCFNCFEWGHSQMGGCFKPRKCKRCEVVEPNHVCTVEMVTPTEENGWNPYVNYTCCNCKQKGHPPTHAKCEKYVKAKKDALHAKEVRNERRWQKRQQHYEDAPPPTTNAWQQPQSSNHEQQQGQRQPNYTQQRTSHSFNMEDEVRDILGINVDELQRHAMDFIELYKTKRTREEKGAALGLYFLKINGWKK